MEPLGRILLIAGIAIAALGGALLLGSRVPWFGRLPGDVSVQRDGFNLYFPITTMLLLSGLLTLALWLFGRMRR